MSILLSVVNRGYVIFSDAIQDKRMIFFCEDSLLVCWSVGYGTKALKELCFCFIHKMNYNYFTILIKKSYSYNSIKKSLHQR